MVTASDELWISRSLVYRIVANSGRQRPSSRIEAVPWYRRFFTDDHPHVLDKAIEHKESLEQHLAGRWQDLFGAKCDLLLYDLTSTYFEGQAGEILIARRGYSRIIDLTPCRSSWPWS
jgi:hypothetical protein